MSRLKKGGAVAALAIALVGSFEGLRLYSYRDVVGVWTGCYGETKNMRAGLRFTKAQCDYLLVHSLEEHEAGMRGCLKHPDALPDKVYVAMLSGTYNFGVAAFCRSTMARKLNDGDYASACDALLLYDKAGGKRLRGLTLRRQKERALCREGLT